MVYNYIDPALCNDYLTRAETSDMIDNPESKMPFQNFDTDFEAEGVPTEMVKDIFREVAEELEYKNTFEGAVEELKKAVESAAAPLAEALAELAKAINESLPNSDEAAAALTDLYKSLDGNGRIGQYSHVEGHQSFAVGQQSLTEGSWNQALGSLKSLGRKEETYVTTFKPGHEPIEITFEEKEKDLLEETSLNDWYDNFLNNL